MLLSVGEVNSNKNHSVVIKALARLGRKDIRYIICGIGDLIETNRALSSSLGIQGQVTFVGYRTDIDRFYQAADAFVISSFREGLPVSLMEAMSAELPCIASKIRGNVDLLNDSQLLFDPHNADGLCTALKKAMDGRIAEREVIRNRETLKRFSMEEAVKAMKRIYTDIISELQHSEECRD